MTHNLIFLLLKSVKKFVCPLCHTSDLRYIGLKNGQPYCRRCISFAESDVKLPNIEQKSEAPSLNYCLSQEQEKISNQIVENYKNKVNTFVHAVCGAGKTELVYGVIAYALSIGNNVAFTIPRRDVVVELYQRLKSAFPNRKVTAIYAGHNDELIGEIIVLTTHQLYRYEKQFDLVIFDEIDAFPYKNNNLLETMFYRSLRGNFVMMSATIDEITIRQFQQKNHSIITLNTRYHRHPLPVPKIEIYFSKTKLYRLIYLLKKYQKLNKPVFVFAPTISIVEEIYRFIKYFVKNGAFVHSKCLKRPQIIDDFKKSKYKFLITTAVLERGVTVANLQVIVYDADHNLYTKEALIQISGRVGRKKECPSGDIIFLADKVTKSMEEAIDEIKGRNLFL